MSIHVPDEERKNRCDMCSKGFWSSSTLREHKMNVHYKLRPHHCRYSCGANYNDLRARNNHEKKKHGGLFGTEVESS